MNKIQKVTIFSMAVVVAVVMFAGQIVMRSDNTTYAFIHFHHGFHHPFFHHHPLHHFHITTIASIASNTGLKQS